MNIYYLTGRCFFPGFWTYSNMIQGIRDAIGAVISLLSSYGKSESFNYKLSLTPSVFYLIRYGY